jgi:RNA polymerase-associated protein CTR9
MRKALHYAQMVGCSGFEIVLSDPDRYSQALHLLPNDKAVLYNIAMIEQKAGEMMFALKPEKRTLVDLQWAIDHATHAQK